MHDGKRIQAIGVAGSDRPFRVRQVISTLPLSLMIKSLEPAPPAEILQLANSLSYRHVRLVALFLNKPAINGNATVYFPEKTFPFTRIYEPRNRSQYMSPAGKTSLVVEIPCYREGDIWQMDDAELVQLITQKLVEVDWIKSEEVIDSWCGRLNFAYPILELGFEDKVTQLMDWLDRFDNLWLSGRNGKFAYTHLHDMMRFGQEIVEEQAALVPAM